MIAAENLNTKKGMKQREAAELFGISRPAVSDRVNGKVSKFSIEKLVIMLARAGKSVKVKVA
jgi:predicted XRE-type DNA-binding protein